MPRKPLRALQPLEGRNYLTVEEAATEMEVSTDTMYDALNKGQIPGLRVGSQWRIPKTALGHLVEQAIATAAEQQNLVHQTINSVINLQQTLDEIRNRLSSGNPTANPKGDRHHPKAS